MAPVSHVCFSEVGVAARGLPHAYFVCHASWVFLRAPLVRFGWDDLSINILELLSMVITAWVFVILCTERPSATGDCVLLRGDDEVAVHWVQRCRGGRETRSGALMRLLCVLEMSSGWHFDAAHVRSVHNVAADGISCWNRESVLANLRAVRPDVLWQMGDLGAVGKSLCASVLASISCVTPLRRRLDALIKSLLIHG